MRYALHRSVHASLAAVFVTALATGCSDSNNGNTAIDNSPLAAYQDPGIGPWKTVARDRMIAECGLDPDILDEIDQSAPYSYAVVRYGKLCHEFYHPDNPGPDEQFNNFSATKTLAATLVGRTALLSENLPRPLNDTDRMDSWIDDISFNQNALVAHVLAMLGFNESLAFGQRAYAYDASGQREINRLSDVLEAVIAQDPQQFSGASTTEELARRELFDRLGMDNSSWDGESFGSTWHSDLHDMARLGLLLIHNGVWNQEQLVSADWVYKMTHPAFEDANTAYGYLTWLASSRNYYLPGLDVNFQQPLAGCQPDALWPEYPHTLSESTDCNYDGAYSCMQTYDVGAFAAAGAGGQLIVGHRALDLVLVTRNAGIAAFIATPWELMRRALIEHDPVYTGDEDAFCAAYRTGDYAPDLIQVP